MTINENILDNAISHSVWLERFKTQTANKILKLLDKADADLIEKLTARIAKIEARGFDIGPASTERLKALQSFIRDDRRKVFRELYGENLDELFDFAEYEADFQARIIEKSVGAAGFTIELNRPSKSLLRSAVTSKPFRGRLLKEWYDGLEQQAAQRVNDRIRLGIVEGETTDQIVRQIRGTKANGFKDGVLHTSRRHTSSVVRTATSHIQARASEEMWAVNDDIIEGLKFVATLDSRTTPICRQYDGQIFDIGDQPVLPLHFNERSEIVPYLGEFETKGNRAARGGPVPEDTSYGDWLRRQPKGVQEEALGVKKAKLFRDGGLSIDRFQDRTGREYTLAELRRRDRDTFNEVFDN